MTARQLAPLALIALLVAGRAAAQPKPSDSVVKATATAEKPDAAGKQLVTITLTIDPDWYLYANPVGNEDFESNQTAVTFKGATAKVEYPAGEAKADKIIGDYKIYKGKVVIKATVQRAAGEAGPLEASVKVQSCGLKKPVCLVPATIKVRVP